MKPMSVVSAFVMLVGFASSSTQAQVSQLPANVAWAAELSGLLTSYWVTPNVTYLTASNVDVKLDVYQVANGAIPAPGTAPRPTLLYIHGGGWTGLSKESSSLAVLPYLELGWNVVNINYRLASTAPAPAAVEDCLCALRWVYRNAKQYNFDTSRIVVSGESSGGHLALMTGMTPASAGLDRQCPGEETKVAAVVNWFGIDDVAELLNGPTARPFAITWLGSLPNRDEIARRVSPLTYARAGVPPIITVHGDADPLVPYTQAIRLRDALTKAGVPNQLVTVPGGKHGGFTRDQMKTAYGSILEFLGKQRVLTAGTPTTAQR